MLNEYNNQTLLIFKDSEPATDEFAVKMGNSSRKIYEENNIKKWYECKNICDNRDDCAYYDYDVKNEKCILYRNEPYKIVNDLSLDQCKNFCSNDDTCDYLSHTVNNECMMYTREKIPGKTAIGDLWFDYSIYGYNIGDKIQVNNFEECANLKKDFVYYPDRKYCIPKEFTNKQLGNTTIFFNKSSIDKYKTLNNIIGLKSKNRDTFEKNKYLVLIVFIIVFVLIFYGIYKKITFWFQ